jgi:uncharacterized protein with ParB-like and HNH nuclease domain
MEENVMKANETELKQVISHADQQFIVPLFQRTYSWNKKEWQELWDDLFDLYESEEPKKHFLGAIVTIPLENTSSQNIVQHLLIDGQQRLTTISILLMIIRDKTVGDMLAQQIETQYLINKFVKDKKSGERYKLRPTQQDRLIFEALIDQQEIASELKSTQIGKCYDFFEIKLRRKKIDLDRLFQIIISQLLIVKIELDSTDNPHIIFESLNAKGKPLTQADLIRNHFLMKIPSDQQEEVFKLYWQPMQEALNDSMPEFVRCYLMAVRGVVVKKTEVYVAMKSYIANKDMTNELKVLATYAEHYQKILNPSRETSLGVRQKLKRINRLSTTLVYPFILRCYHDYMVNSLTEEDFCTLLYFTENAIIRRSICNLSLHLFDIWFSLLYRDAKLNDSDDFVNSVANILSKKGIPNDYDFRTALINNTIYSRSERLEKPERIKLVLESLETELRKLNKSNDLLINFDELRIEFVMPQEIKENNRWQEYLGENWETDHEAFACTLGNLTLIDFKSEESFSFSEKQKLLVQSDLELNRYFANIHQWKPEQIKQRAKTLADLALDVWTYLGK